MKNGPLGEALAVITGASSGIGAATANRLARAGYNVQLVARREAALQDLAQQIRSNGGRADVLVADLAKVGERRLVVDQIQKYHGNIDLLVNCAGLGWYGYGEEMSWKVAQQMIAVNVGAVVRLSLLVLPLMKKRRRGHIINVGSIAGSLPSQGIALYSATKSFIDSFTTSLYRELRGTNVHISVIRPGAVATPFFGAASHREKGQKIPAERWAILPDQVADRILALTKRPKRIAYVPRVLSLTPWVELCFGWLMDRVGPLLLKKSAKGPSR